MSRSPTKSQLKFHHSHVIDRYGIVEGGTLVVLEDEAEWCRQGRGALFLSDTNGGGERRLVFLTVDSESS